MKHLVSLFFLLCITGVFAMRLFADHSNNLHYTGDYLSEKTLMVTADNFEKLGFIKSRGMPIFEPISDEAEQEIQFYTHYPPLPYWLYGGIYLAFGKSEIAARIFALLLSLIGLYFAVRCVFLIRELLSAKNTGDNDTSNVLMIVVSLFVLNPTFLFFADNIQHQSLIDALQWPSLFWCLKYLFRKTSLWWGILLYSIHVWTSFEWMVPLFLISSFCIYKRAGNIKSGIKPFILFAFIGFLFPFLGRLFHNSWALGGFLPALSDLLLRAQVRSFGEPSEIQMQYSFIKHIGKISFGMLWFVGIPVLFLCATYASQLWKRLKENQPLLQLLLLWGVGGISWQFLMPQNAMIHAYSQIYIANFVFLVAAICLALFWMQNKKTIAVLTLLFAVESGMVIKSEIFLPFVSKSTQTLAFFLCADDKNKLLRRVSTIQSEMVVHLRSELEKTTPSPLCNVKSVFAKNVLSFYGYGIKSHLTMPKTP